MTASSSSGARREARQPSRGTGSGARRQAWRPASGTGFGAPSGRLWPSDGHGSCALSSLLRLTCGNSSSRDLWSPADHGFPQRQHDQRLRQSRPQRRGQIPATPLLVRDQQPPTDAGIPGQGEHPDHARRGHAGDLPHRAPNAPAAGATRRAAGSAGGAAAGDQEFQKRVDDHTESVATTTDSFGPSTITRSTETVSPGRRGPRPSPNGSGGATPRPAPRPSTGRSRPLPRSACRGPRLRRGPGVSGSSC